LKSTVDFAVLQCKGSHIEIENLPPEMFSFLDIETALIPSSRVPQ